MVTEFAQFLNKRGHEVHVLAGFPSYPDGHLCDGYRRGVVVSELDMGVYVHRFWSTIYKTDFIRRILFFLSWSWSVRLLGRRLPSPDVVFVEIPPPSSALAAISLGRYFRCPIVARIQDMHPDSAISSGFVKNTFLVQYLLNQEKRIYDSLDKIFVIGNGFKSKLLEKGVSQEKVAICRNWINTSEILPKPRYPNPVRDLFGIPGTTRIVLYAGTMGRSHGTHVFLDAAQKLMNEEAMADVLFVFVGRGAERTELEKKIRDESIKNARVFDPVERKDLSHMLSMGDITLVSLKPGFANLSVPSKVLGYLAVGKPILALVEEDCDTANIIREAECGEVLNPDNPEKLANALRDWLSNDSRRERAGIAARRYCEYNLNREVLLEHLAVELETGVNV